MADEDNQEDAFEEDTQLEAAADALEAEQEDERPGWWRWRKAAALVTFGKKADEPPRQSDLCERAERKKQFRLSHRTPAAGLEDADTTTR